MIEVVTLLTKEVVANFTRYNLSRSKWTIIICSVLLLGLAILLLSLGGDIILSIVAIALSFIIPVLFIWLNYLMTNMLYKNSFLQEEQAYMKFLFNQDNFEFENNIGGLITTSVLIYQNILKCIETKDFFYLYINKNYAYIVDKNGFRNGNVLELSELLKFNCKKYKRVVKN